VLDLRSATWTAPDEYRVDPTARRFELWESSVAGMLGLGAAVDYALAWGLDAIEERAIALGARLRTALREVDGVTVHDQGERQCGIVTFSVDGVGAEDVKRRLAEAKITTTVSSSQSAQYDFTARGLPDLVRASVHYYNTDDEIAQLIDVLQER
jgi:cysteine desulfurase / selenocysteine lyase